MTWLPPQTEAATLERLRGRLAAEAERADLLGIGYRTVDTPVGSLLLAATERGLIRVAFACEDHDAVLEDLATRIGPRILRAPARLDAVATQLEEYFSGTRTGFSVPLDHTLSTPFRRIVQEFLPHIGYGHTLTYREVAGRVGNPRAMRAVGSACATNPLPIVLPCHRVLRTDGGLGGYIGGLEAKTTLLELEHAR